ncbi:MAG TPA: PAS domain-containing protein [Steroidobacteraceae bacterium]|nr:PAS domain-containing protein [Steroidobacteraceae bacterium]
MSAFSTLQDHGLAIAICCGGIVVLAVMLVRNGRKLAAARRMAREARLMVERMPALAWSARPDGQLEYMNPRILEYTGKSIRDLQFSEGFRHPQVVHPDDVDRAATGWVHSLRTGEPYDVELRIRRFDGAYRWFNTVAQAARDGGETITGWYGLVVDIDERKRAEQALKASEQNLKSIIDSIPGMIALANAEGVHEYSNQRVLDFTGTPLGEHTNSGWVNAIHPDDRDAVLTEWRRCVAAREPMDNIHRLRRFDGVYRWIHARVEPSFNDVGEVTRWHGLLVDVDDNRKMEVALRSTRTRLARASQLAALAELSASIAHEIRQPLTAVVANGHACRSWLSAEPPNLERAQLSAERVIRDANSAAAVVSRMRALFKRTQLTGALLDVNDVIVEACQLINDDAAGKNVGIELDLEADLPPAWVDRVQVQQVLVNLARNAVEAMDATVDGTKLLTIRSLLNGPGAVMVEIRDNGGGIEDPEKVFEPFFTTKDEGMGMGLAICRSIIEAHAGQLWATRHEGPGTTFSFTLPVRAAEPG